MSKSFGYSVSLFCQDVWPVQQHTAILEARPDPKNDEKMDWWVVPDNELRRSVIKNKSVYLTKRSQKRGAPS